MRQITQFNLWTRLIGMAVAALAITASVVGFPKPAAVPYRWELSFEPGDLRLHVDDVTGAAYWYFTYMVTNQTGKDQLWAPSLVLYTDTGEILPAGKDVPVRITQELLALLGNPLMEDQNQIIGDIHQGKEHAKEGLVVWPVGNLEVNEISLFISGISGETARIKNPVSSEEVILRKTLQRDYLIPGEALARRREPAELVSQAWILR
jgi:hypothetical protein